MPALRCLSWALRTSKKFYAKPRQLFSGEAASTGQPRTSECEMGLVTALLEIISRTLEGQGSDIEEQLSLSSVLLALTSRRTLSLPPRITEGRVDKSWTVSETLVWEDDARCSEPVVLGTRGPPKPPPHSGTGAHSTEKTRRRQKRRGYRPHPLRLSRLLCSFLSLY